MDEASWTIWKENEKIIKNLTFQKTFLISENSHDLDNTMGMG